MSLSKELIVAVISSPTPQIIPPHLGPSESPTLPPIILPTPFSSDSFSNHTSDSLPPRPFLQSYLPTPSLWLLLQLQLRPLALPTLPPIKPQTLSDPPNLPLYFRPPSPPTPFPIIPLTPPPSTLHISNTFSATLLSGLYASSQILKNDA